MTSVRVHDVIGCRLFLLIFGQRFSVMFVFWRKFLLVYVVCSVYTCVGYGDITFHLLCVDVVYVYVQMLYARDHFS